MTVTNHDVDTLIAELEMFWRDYAKAFQTGDLGLLLPAFSLPLVIQTRDRTGIYESLEDIDANNNALVAFYRSQGVKRVEVNLDTVDPLHRDFMQVHLTYRMLDLDDAEIISWTTIYGLKHAGSRWLIHSIIAQDEVNAWEKYTAKQISKNK